MAQSHSTVVLPEDWHMLNMTAYVTTQQNHYSEVLQLYREKRVPPEKASVKSPSARIT